MRGSKDAPRLQRIELSEKHKTLRLVLVVVLLAVAAVAIVIAMLSGLETPAGWHSVEVLSSETHCGNDFVLQYEYGAGEMGATAEKKQLTTLYSREVENAWRLFSKEAEGGDLQKISAGANQVVTVDPALYRAFSQLEAANSRLLYYSGVQDAYSRVFYSENADYALACDPTRDEDTRAYVQSLVAYAADPEAITLELKGNNSVCLHVSQYYLQFARENELDSFLDFGWLKNAFIADYLAEKLQENGFHHGYLVSVDGFTRNFDSWENSFRFNLFNRRGSDVDLAGVLEYSGPMSLVFLRDYPMYDVDTARYYTFPDGRILTAMFDPADGMSKAAAHNLVAYADDLGCAQLLLKMIPCYVAQELSVDALTAEGIGCIWFRDTKLCHSGNPAAVTTQGAYTKE